MVSECGLGNVVVVRWVQGPRVPEQINGNVLRLNTATDYEVMRWSMAMATTGRRVQGSVRPPKSPAFGS